MGIIIRYIKMFMRFNFLYFFDCIIIVKQKYKKLHFRNGFIRCQDYESTDYDRILAYSYYELKIKNLKNKEDSENESKRNI